MTPNEREEVLRLKKKAEDAIGEWKKIGLFRPAEEVLKSATFLAGVDAFKSSAAAAVGMKSLLGKTVEAAGTFEMGVAKIGEEMERGLGLSSMFNAAKIEKLLAPINVKEIERELGLDSESEARRRAMLESLTSAMVSKTEYRVDPSLFRRPDEANRKPRLRRQAGFNRGGPLPKVLDKGWDPGPIGF